MQMKKKILIISNPGDLGAENYCEGVQRDVENYKTYFTSPGGGNWYLSEIECLEKPDKITVREKLRTMKDLDFSIVIFTGHGYSNEGKTYIELRSASDSENDLCVEELKETKQKRIIIVDCCRKEWKPISELNESYMAHIEKSFTRVSDTREIYENRIKRLDVMNIVMYSCDLGETSGDDSRKGGYYTSSLLKVCAEYIEKNSNVIDSCYLSAAEAHEKVKIYVTKLKADQKPQIEKPRSREYLPFAVVRGILD